MGSTNRAEESRARMLQLPSAVSLGKGNASVTWGEAGSELRS